MFLSVCRDVLTAIKKCTLQLGIKLSTTAVHHGLLRWPRRAIPFCHPAILLSCHSSILPFCHPAILLFFHSAILPFILCACAIMHTCYHAHAQLCTRRLRCGCKSLVASCFVVVCCLLKRAASGETQEERHSC